MTYSIKEVSKIFNLSIYTLRYYDKQGLLPFVSKNQSGYREFTESDLNLIHTICCLKNTGMPLKQIRTYIDCVMEGPVSIEARKQLLLDHRKVVLKNLEKLTENLKEVDVKIA
ncbi:MerR family transcriptional regulator, partial [Listeria monocytogenes]|nr:MerR family transcriptional regulator [Listeria monocytogenes]